MQTPQRDSRKFLSKRRLAGLLGLPAVVVVGILGMRDLLSPLPRGAFPVLSTVGWAARGSWSDLDAQAVTPPHYLWLANGDLVFLERNAHGMFEVCYRKMSGKGSVGEVRHGPELPTTNQAGPFWGDFFPSPDEQWVAYSLDNNSSPNQTDLISADGKTARTLPYEFEAWLSDSRSFLVTSTVEPYPWEVHHLDSPRAEAIPDLPRSGMTTRVSAMAKGPDFLLGEFVRDPHSSVEVEWLAPTMTLRSLHPAPPEIVQQKWPVQIPVGAEYGSVSASPDNKHLLWSMKMMQKRPSFWLQWVWRVNSNWLLPNRYERHYFVSDIYGGDMHPVLRCSLTGTKDFRPLWTPDSQHVSFIKDEQLYLAPVE